MFFGCVYECVCFTTWCKNHAEKVKSCTQWFCCAPCFFCVIFFCVFNALASSRVVFSLLLARALSIFGYKN